MKPSRTPLALIPTHHEVANSIQTLIADEVGSILQEHQDELTQTLNTLQETTQVLLLKAPGFSLDQYVFQLSHQDLTPPEDFEIMRPYYGDLIDTLEYVLHQTPQQIQNTLRLRFWNEIFIPILLEQPYKQQVEHKLQLSQDEYHELIWIFDPQNHNKGDERYHSWTQKLNKATTLELRDQQFFYVLDEVRESIFSQLKQITTLHINSWFSESPHHTLYSALTKHLSGVTKIHSSYAQIEHATDEDLARLSECFPNTRSLNIKRLNRYGFSYGKLNILLSRFPNLKVFQGSEMYTKSEMNCIERNFPNLSFFELNRGEFRDQGYCESIKKIMPRLTGCRFKSLQLRGEEVNQLREIYQIGSNLRYLELSSFILEDLDDEEYEAFFESFPHLQHLKLDDCQKLFSSKRKLASFIKGASKLRSLEIGYLPLAKARETYAYLLQQLPGLHTLKVSRFWSLTHDTFGDEEKSDFINFLASALHIPHLELLVDDFCSINPEILNLVFSHTANRIKTLKVSERSKFYLQKEVPIIGEKLI